MGKLLKIEPNSKDGLIESISHALEEARKGNIKSLILGYEKKDTGTLVHYAYGNKANCLVMIELRKKDILENEYPVIVEEEFGNGD